ncbi:hypothetical protein K458DRAFT_388897 [Lentithecium fluviatile CBS 122367]|uniref:F-box domain-containing protein n=1 Tax=Lentithecium fluviatile CBS 122367 TaxID=1168545 RepID=A0A6G1J1Z4_9PLEO|nr:hypothetical protein K458DRAFT_388897 [Lentithecium fluviatile CBS 122367]
MENLNRTELAERFKKRLTVLDENLEKLKKLLEPPEAPPTGILRLPIEIRLEVYYYCIPRKQVIDFEDVQEEMDLESDHDLEHGVVYDSDLEDGVVHESDLGTNFVDYWNLNKNKNSIFLLSEQINEEALDVLYGENFFKLHLNGTSHQWMILLRVL